MGHKPVDVEPVNNEKLSRPAELVQRAKQLSQLTSFQFGRTTMQAPVQQPAPQQIPQHLETPITPRITTPAPVAAAPAPAAPAPTPVPAPEITQQKLDEFYGVKQMGDEVVFSVKIDQAKHVLIAGEFNNWSPMSTPMQTNGRPGVWTTKLPLPRGRLPLPPGRRRQVDHRSEQHVRRDERVRGAEQRRRSGLSKK